MTDPKGYELPDATVIDKSLLQKYFLLHGLPTMAANTDLVLQVTTENLWGTLGEMRKAEDSVWATVHPKFSGPLKQVFVQSAHRALPSVAISEGILTGDTDLVTERQALLELMLVQLQQSNAIQVKAPPASGKTSLAQLLHRKVTLEYPNWKVTYFNFNLCGYAFDKFETSWQDITNIDWSTSLKTKVPHLMLFDEGQKSYTIDHPVWIAVKLAMQKVYAHVYIVLFCAYGGDNAIGWSPSIIANEATIFLIAQRLPGLCFTDDEFDEIMGVFTTKYFPLSTENKNYISYISGNHPGIVKNILFYLSQHVINEKRADPDKHVGTYMRSRLFQNNIVQNTRGLPTIEHLKSIAKKGKLAEVFDLLDTLLDDGHLLYSAELPHHRQALSMVKYGILATDNIKFTFPSPFHERTYLLSRYTTERPKDPPASFNEFVKFAVCCMRPEQFRNTLSVGVNRTIFERQFQMEFYRAAAALIPAEYYVSPDVPRSQQRDDERETDIDEGNDTTGYLDFYVNSSLKWGVEMLRDNHLLSEHYKRFLPGGRYSNIDMNEWVVIDFRTSASKPIKSRKEGREHVCYVKFDEEFTTASVKWGETNATWAIVGDKLDRPASFSMGETSEDEEVSASKKAKAKKTTPKQAAKMATPKQAAKMATPKQAAKMATPKQAAKMATPKAKETMPAPKAKETMPAPKAKETMPAPKAKETMPAPKAKETMLAPKSGDKKKERSTNEAKKKEVQAKTGEKRVAESQKEKASSKKKLKQSHPPPSDD